MFLLYVFYEDKKYYRGDCIRVKGVDLRIEHITANGFLYNKKAGEDHDYVIVHSRDGRTRSYYNNWDYLEFIPCAVVVEEV